MTETALIDRLVVIGGFTSLTEQVPAVVGQLALLAIVVVTVLAAVVGGPAPTAGAAALPRHHRSHPEPADQTANPERNGSADGRPVGSDARDDKNRNVVERFFDRMKNSRGLASRYDNLAVVYRGGVVSPRPSTGSHDHQDRP